MAERMVSRREFLIKTGCFIGAAASLAGGLTFLEGCSGALPTTSVKDLKDVEDRIGKEIKISFPSVILETLEIQADCYTFKIYDENDSKNDSLYYKAINTESSLAGYDVHNPGLPGTKQTGRLEGKLRFPENHPAEAKKIKTEDRYIAITGFWGKSD
ncbi:MAG: hypothetical protein A2152_01805 [Candidatus Levybacteria bacterium RBG_16_35_6]|nr:MAG: hypothetical protein A2152_01805 [Candidatus Levybacteria bacterium RBG_16_35_6]